MVHASLEPAGPRVSPRDVAPRHIFVKIDDSCDLTETWPRTDPSFFDNVAVNFLARCWDVSRMATMGASATCLRNTF